MPVVRTTTTMRTTTHVVRTNVAKATEHRIRRSVRFLHCLVNGRGQIAADILKI